MSTYWLVTWTGDRIGRDSNSRLFREEIPGPLMTMMIHPPLKWLVEQMKWTNHIETTPDVCNESGIVCTGILSAIECVDPDPNHVEIVQSTLNNWASSNL